MAGLGCCLDDTPETLFRQRARYSLVEPPSRVSSRLGVLTTLRELQPFQCLPCAPWWLSPANPKVAPVFSVGRQQWCHARRAPAHVSAAGRPQTEICRRMTPSRRLTQAMRMNGRTRELMDSGRRDAAAQIVSRNQVPPGPVCNLLGYKHRMHGRRPGSREAPPEQMMPPPLTAPTPRRRSAARRTPRDTPPSRRAARSAPPGRARSPAGA